ncbi:MAG: SDR family NAD(P)-dependent oxidoreductase [Kosmotogaceae bacterium]
MGKERPGIIKYWKQYKWSNIAAMMRNNKGDPEICTDDFRGKLMVITGGTSGIGYYTCRKYASHGARILSINRNKEKSEKLCEELKRDYGAECDYIIADFSLLEDTLRAGKELSRIRDNIDVLIHNAGVYLTHKTFTKDGFEMTFFVNYLSSFIINYIVKDKLKAQKAARIILVNSEGHRFAAWGIKLNDLNFKKKRYTGLRAYGSAKTAQLLSVMIFDEVFRNSNVTINAMHPGNVKAGTGKENGAFYNWYKRTFIDKRARSPEISAESLYYLGASKKVEGISGKFFNLTTLEEPAPPALDMEVAKKLWSKSIQMGGLNHGKL